jgi:hypothetical protein
MAPQWLNIVAALLAVPLVLASPFGRPFDAVKRQANTNGTTNSLQVDLGYATYEGYSNSSTGLNVFKGCVFSYVN